MELRTLTSGLSARAGELVTNAADVIRTFGRQAKRRPDMREVSSSGADLYARYALRPYNPDELARKKGGLKLYDQMRRDDQIKACLTLKKRARLSTGWDIEAASEDQRDQEIADFVRWNLQHLPGTIERDLAEILSALDYGFSVTEKVWHVLPTGPWRGLIGLKGLKTRRPHSFDFDSDEFGNLKPDGIVQSVTGFQDRRYPADKFIVFSYQGEFDNPYGESDLRSAYRSWWSKDVVIKFWNIFLERFGMPTVVGTHGRGAQKEDLAALDQVLGDIQTRTAIRLPEDLKISLLEAVRRGEAGYESAVEKHNTMIARSLLVPEKLGLTESDGGSYALGQKHFDLFMIVLEELGTELEETVMFEQVIRQLVDYNWADVEDYPRFRFNPLTEEDRNQLMQRFAAAVNSGFMYRDHKPDVDHARKNLGLPELEEDTWLDRQQARQEHLDRLAPDDGEDDDDDEDPPKRQGRQFSEETLTRALTTYEQKVDWPGVVRVYTDRTEDLYSALAAIAARQRDALIRDVVKKAGTGQLTAKGIEKLQLKYVGDVRLAMRDALYTAWQAGHAAAGREVKQGRADSRDHALPQDVFGPTTQLDFFAAKAFTIAGLERDYILRQARMILYNHLKNGNLLKDTMFKLQELFAPYIARGEAPGQLLRRGRLETIVRTNVNEAYNEGRRALYRDPAVVDFVPAYQYSAILDERTRDNHAAMDGKVFLATDPIWDEWWPPNGYNCRCLVVPVTKGEQYTIDAKPSVTPDEGFYTADDLAAWREYRAQLAEGTQLALGR